jgi:LPS-assembly protein
MTLAGCLLAGAATTVVAQSAEGARLDWQPWAEEEARRQVCRGRYVMPAYRLPAGRDLREIGIETDESDYAADGEAMLQGDVVLRQGDRELQAERLFVPASRERVDAQGNFELRDGKALLRGEEATLYLEQDRGSIEDSEYVLYEQRVRGEARQLEQLGEQLYRLRDASFTTCEPDQDSWQLISSDIRLNQAEGFGVARHARLEVKGVPVFYWPWLRFPIDDRRQTGLLSPSVSFSSEQLDYTQPFYWNIAPNQDATITPRWLSDRGLLLGGQYRYLTEHYGSGILEGAWLNSDDGGSGGDANRYKGQDRWYLDVQHSGQINAASAYQLRYGGASDGRYFNDFSDNFGSSERSGMERLAQVDYLGERWRLDARMQGYQRLDDPLSDSDKPFYRLPSLTAAATWIRDDGLYAEWNSNATYFWRDVDQRQVPIREAANGSRVHLAPVLGWRYEKPWGYLAPRAELWYTAYALDYGSRQTTRDTSPDRGVAITSVDAGLNFERELALGERDYRQTLEPRINYAFVPRTNQVDMPEFDSRERAFSWDQLWSPKRFSGSDRVGDLNRLSVGFESRLIEDSNSQEHLSVGVGQSLYFSDRRVGIDGNDQSLPQQVDINPDVNPERFYQATRNRSPLVSRLEWQINPRWSTSAEWLYDDQRELTERTGVDIAYRHTRGHVMNLGYRWEIEGFDPALDPVDDNFRAYNREEWDLSFAWKASPSIDLIGRYLHDQTNDRALEKLAGVQWNDCCYGLQLVWRNWIDDNDTARIADDFNDRGLFLRFVLHGLGGVGQDADNYFERTIPGYRPSAL